MTASDAAAVVVGAQPRPRALVLGLSEADAAPLKAVFPTLRVIGHLVEVAQNEWDALVTKDGVGDAADHLFVLAVEGDLIGKRFGWAQADRATAMEYRDYTAASEFVIPAGLPPDLHRLVRDTLAPEARSRSAQYVLTANTGPYVPVPKGNVIRPFLLTSEGKVIAGSFRRLGGKADCWCLPSYITNLVPWAAAAVAEWRGMDLSRFPRPATWQRRDDWRTASEVVLLSERKRLEAVIAAAIRESQTQIEAVDQKLLALSQATDAKERALLTAQSDALSKVVMACLQHLGFLVDDMDAVWPPGDKREDLRVRDPGDPAKIALVEVRGYTRGAQLADLMRMQRFAARFQKDAGRAPDLLWYVVNHSLADDPSQRQPALASNPAEIETFAESGGLVVDTVELFKVWQAVEARTVDPALARSMLMKAAGRFSANSIATRAGVAPPGPRTK